MQEDRVLCTHKVKGSGFGASRYLDGENLVIIAAMCIKKGRKLCLSLQGHCSCRDDGFGRPAADSPEDLPEIS